jgi:hypothetical protein
MQILRDQQHLPRSHILRPQAPMPVANRGVDEFNGFHFASGKSQISNLRFHNMKGKRIHEPWVGFLVICLF